uniref:Uncharacterized protein n=1 Tax=Panagrolaimus sp. PS1159 TaxID=55785 RepID=A0AC35ERK8_9BILA
MASSRNLVLHVQYLTKVDSYNIQTKQKDHQEFFDGYANFFDRLQSGYNLKHVKAIAFTFMDSEFYNFVEFYNIRLKCREFCEKHQIFYLFFDYDLFLSFSPISQAKTMVKEGEKVMVFLLDFPCLPPPLTFIRQNKSYRCVNTVCSKFPPFTQQWQDDMFQGLNPKKIIFAKDHGSSELEKAQKFFKSYNPIVVDFDIEGAHTMDTIVNKVLHLMDEKDDPYDVEVPFLEKFEIRYDGKTLIEAGETEAVPFERSVIVNVVPKKSVSMYASFQYHPELVKEVKLSEFKTKKVKVTLKLDINSFYDFKVEPFVGEEEEDAIANVAEKLHKVNIDADKKTIKEEAKRDDKENGERKPPLNDPETVEIDKQVIPEKVQMIFDKQYFCVSYFANGKEYNVNDSDDLIKLCSVSIADIDNPKWESKLSKEEKEESLFLTFEAFEGKTKSAVKLLLAIILKNGYDRIKKETGKKFEEIEIKFDGFSPNEILKKNFIEAGKLFNVKIVFV